jgi:hypothetical protein
MINGKGVDTYHVVYIVIDILHALIYMLNGLLYTLMAFELKNRNIVQNMS